VNAVEYKGSTDAEKLVPRAVNPATQSKGYVLKAPGEADKTAPQAWQIDSYALTPGFVTVQQGDTVTVQVLVVNGDKHEVGVLAPDGQVVVPTATWNRGVEYRVSFVAEKVGAYKLSCETRAPTMTANILVLPRSKEVVAGHRAASEWRCEEKERVCAARGGSVYASDSALPMSTPCGEKRPCSRLLSTFRDATWPRIRHHLRRDGA
jgi:plastocyanin